MIVTATELATESKRVLDRVIASGEQAEVQRRGRTVAELRPLPGVGRVGLLKRLRGAGLGAGARREMKAAMDATSEVFGYAGRD